MSGPRGSRAHNGCVHHNNAESIGADAVFEYNDSDFNRTVMDVMDFTGEAGVGIVVISASSPGAFEFATRISGGMPTGQTLSLDTNWLHYNQFSITGTFSSTPAMLQAAARIAAEKAVDLSKIVTHQYSLADIEKAMAATEKYHGLRAVINKF